MKWLINPVVIIAGVVTIIPTEGGTTYVNGTQISEPTKLTTGCRIILGNNHVFRYNNPDEGKCTLGVFEDGLVCLPIVTIATFHHAIHVSHQYTKTLSIFGQ